MSRKRIYIIIGLVVVVVVLLLIIRPGHQGGANVVNDGKEPEADILSSVTFSGDDKLITLLPTPQVKAAKKELSTYIQATYGSNTRYATIESTTLQNDGGIGLSIRISNGDKTFSAIIYSSTDQFIFKVPAQNYQTVTPQSTVTTQFGSN
jgi:hypothetical protein